MFFFQNIFLKNYKKSFNEGKDKGSLLAHLRHFYQKIQGVFYLNKDFFRPKHLIYRQIEKNGSGNQR